MAGMVKFLFVLVTLADSILSGGTPVSAAQQPAILAQRLVPLRADRTAVNFPLAAPSRCVGPSSLTPKPGSRGNRLGEWCSELGRAELRFRRGNFFACPFPIQSERLQI